MLSMVHKKPVKTAMRLSFRVSFMFCWFLVSMLYKSLFSVNLEDLLHCLLLLRSAEPTKTKKCYKERAGQDDPYGVYLYMVVVKYFMKLLSVK